MKGILANFDKEGNIRVNGAYIRYATAEALPRIIIGIKDLEGIDELIVPGGVDLDPTLWGADNLDSSSCNRWLDEFQVGVVSEAVCLKIPILGICRGFQLLYRMFLSHDPKARYAQHISGHNQMENELGRGDAFHQIVRLKEFDLWPKLNPGEVALVNSMHHQGVLADGDLPAWATSFSSTGAKKPTVVIESLETVVKGVRIRGVQWHPEELNNARHLW